MNLAREMEQHLPRQLLELVKDISRQAAERGEQVYLVGGVVRDLFFKRPVLDIDLVVEGDAVRLAREVAGAGRAELLAHHRFGTATLRCGEYTLDIATARTETYTEPGALPEVSAGTLRDDLGRRDFSINAMAVSLLPDDYGQLIDPYNGRDDLEQRLIRVLHPGSFRDDGTRILRGVRYEQRFGFRFEAETHDLLIRGVPMLDTISGDRIRHELELILRENEPESAINRLAELGALQRIGLYLEGDAEPGRLFSEARRMGEASQLPTLYFCLLAYSSDRAYLERLLNRLNMPAKLSRAMQDTLRLKNSLGLLDRPSLRPSEVYDLLKGYDTPAIQANAIASESSAARSRLGLFLTHLRHVRPSLDGEDLKQQGITPGPEMGRILRALHKAKLDGEVGTRTDEERLAHSLRASADDAEPESQR